MLMLVVLTHLAESRKAGNLLEKSVKGQTCRTVIVTWSWRQ